MLFYNNDAIRMDKVYQSEGTLPQGTGKPQQGLAGITAIAAEACR